MRLVDADLLWKDLDTAHLFGDGNPSHIAQQIVDEQPTVDAVKVVRCENCRYWDGDGRCYEIKNGLIMVYTDGHDYCSYGRKDGAEE